MPTAILVHIRDGKVQGEYMFEKGPIAIGRLPESHIVLADPQVSRRHARILLEKTGFFLEDLNSTNFVYINGTRTSWGALSHGDVINVGGVADILFLTRPDGDLTHGLLERLAQGRAPTPPSAEPPPAPAPPATPGERPPRPTLEMLLPPGILQSAPTQGEGAELATTSPAIPEGPPTPPERAPEPDDAAPDPELDPRKDIAALEAHPSEEALVLVVEALSLLHSTQEPIEPLLDIVLRTVHGRRAYVLVRPPADVRGARLLVEFTRGSDGAALDEEEQSDYVPLIAEAAMDLHDIISSTTADATMLEELSRMGKRAFREVLCVPLVMKNWTLGALYIDGCRLPEGRFESLHLLTADALAHIISEILERGRLERELRDRQERHRALASELQERTRALREAESALADLRSQPLLPAAPPPEASPPADAPTQTPYTTPDEIPPPDPVESRIGSPEPGVEPLSEGLGPPPAASTPGIEEDLDESSPFSEAWGPPLDIALDQDAALSPGDEEPPPRPLERTPQPTPAPPTTPPSPGDLLEDPIDPSLGPPLLPGMVGQSPALAELAMRTRQVARYFDAVLISGNRGTGKKLLARAIHSLSSRSKGPLVAVRGETLDAEMGPVKLLGRFNEETRQLEDGLLSRARGGILLIEDVDQVSLTVQNALYRALEQGTWLPVGFHDPQALDVKLLVTTVKDLREQVDADRFHSELYYDRLGIVQLHVPSLAYRKEDVSLLCRHFTSSLTRRLGKPVPGVASDTLEVLREYPWKAHVLELRNALRTAVMAVDGPEIRIEHLPEELQRFHRSRQARLARGRTSAGWSSEDRA